MLMAARTPATDAPPLSRLMRWGYALGSTANGVNSKILGAFTLIFYNQVIGLPAATVAKAITIALIIDAITAPALGLISDNLRSRFGRRHPFMFLAMALYPIAFVLLWNPPEGWSASAVGAWLMVTLIAVRVLDTFFELPFTALLPELVTDYDDRTRLAALRYFIGIIAATGSAILAYQVFMPEGAHGSGGIDERAGWAPFSITCALISLAAIALATLSTAKRIPWLSKPPLVRPKLKVMFKDLGVTLGSRSFVVTTAFGGLAAMASGLYFGLNLYFQLYFWGLSQGQMSVLTIATIAAAALALVIAPRVGRWLGKKHGAMLLLGAAALLCHLPILLRVLFDAMPPPGSTALLVILWIQGLLFPVCNAGQNILLTSMIADMVEEAERRTGHRSEGVLNSAETLFKKIISGGGALAAGWILTLVAFPKGAAKTGVPEHTLDTMGLLYVGISLAFTALAICALSFYRLDRSAHEANLRWLRGGTQAAE